MKLKMFYNQQKNKMIKLNIFFSRDLDNILKIYNINNNKIKKINNNIIKAIWNEKQVIIFSIIILLKTYLQL